MYKNFINKLIEFANEIIKIPPKSIEDNPVIYRETKNLLVVVIRSKKYPL